MIPAAPARVGPSGGMKMTVRRRATRTALALAFAVSACSSSAEPTSEGGAGTQLDTPAATDGGPPASVWTMMAPQPPSDLPGAASESDAAAQVEAMFRDVATFMANDPRSADGGLLDVIEERSAQQGAPDLVLAIFASVTGHAADAFGIVQAHSSAGLGVGFASAEEDYFEEQQQIATKLRDANAAVHDITIRAQALTNQGRSCIAEALMEDYFGCGEDAATDALLADFETAIDIGLPEGAGAFYNRVFATSEVCLLWDNVAAEVGAGQVERLDLFTGGWLMDSFFLGRAACRSDAGLEPYPLPDGAGGRTAFGSVYDAVVDTAPQIADDVTAAMALYEAGLLRPEDYATVVPFERPAIAAVSAAVAPVARATWRSVDEPHARLGLLFIAFGGELEAWYQAEIAEQGFGYLPERPAGPELPAEVDSLAPCAPILEPTTDLSACGQEERRIAEALDRLSLGSFSSVKAPHSIVDWVATDDAVDLCGAWAEATGQTSAETNAHIEFALWRFGLEKLLGLERCPLRTR